MNYFNYFTDVEEHFQRARGTSLFLLSPLDWALLESWKNSGVPLEAVLQGIDAAFEKWQLRRIKTQAVNSLAFCAQAVLTQAQRSAGTAGVGADSPPFSEEELREYLEQNAQLLRRAGLNSLADSLDTLLGGSLADLEALELQLTVLEQKMIGLQLSLLSDEDAVEHRRELESQLRPYRSKMNAEQLSMLERQFLERKVLESKSLPRLSLFYFK